MDKARTICCPNPKCKCEIPEPIVINDFSTRPKRRYNGCPNCFSEVKLARARANPSSEVKLVPSQVQKEELKTNPIENEEKNSLPCNKYQGYLESLAKKIPISEECLACPNLLECALKK